MPWSTNFPARPSKTNSDAANVAWTVWQNLQWFTTTVYDVFVNKFASGTAVVSVGNTTVVVPHSLGTASFQVNITPLSDPGSRWWVSGKTASQFTINLQTAGGAVSFDWEAKAQ